MLTAKHHIVTAITAQLRVDGWRLTVDGSVEKYCFLLKNVLIGNKRILSKLLGPQSQACYRALTSHTDLIFRRNHRTTASTIESVKQHGSINTPQNSKSKQFHHKQQQKGLILNPYEDKTTNPSSPLIKISVEEFRVKRMVDFFTRLSLISPEGFGLEYPVFLPWFRVKWKGDQG